MAATMKAETGNAFILDMVSPGYIVGGIPLAFHGESQMWIAPSGDGERGSSSI
jgi:hypothetical protein